MENGQPGKKVFKGLGTDDEGTAKRLEAQLNALLAREEFHSVGSRAAAAASGEYESIIIDIFYDDLTPSTTSHRMLRERLLPLPTMEPGQAVRTLILGNSGVGKTTLLRRLIGSDAERDRFPATSVNRTTTCEIEIITGQSGYSAAVTFLTQHQAQQEVIEALSNAVFKALLEESDEAIMTDLLDDTDQRCRLKYALGAWSVPKQTAIAGNLLFSKAETAPKTVENSLFLKNTLASIRKIASFVRKEEGLVQGKLETFADEKYNSMLDEMQQKAEGSEAFLDLVNEIMEEIEARFSRLTAGKFIKTTTGWPQAWTFSTNDRDMFLKEVRSFCSNTKNEWGQLLTPLVTGIRVKGDFRPSWVPEGQNYEHVFIDTQGLDHEKPTTELSSETTSLFSQVHNILFVESGKDSLKSQSARKVMEAIAGSGYTSNLTVVLSHMDLVKDEDDIPSDEDRKAKAFSGLRSLVDNEVSQNVSREAGRQLAAQLERSTFYLEYLDPKKYPVDWEQDERDAFDTFLGHQLTNLTGHLCQRATPQDLKPCIPEYSYESLGLAVREISVAFQDIWEARLGYKRMEGIPVAPWQSIKAMARRYADGTFENYWLRPTDALASQTRSVLTRFLESPLQWEAHSNALNEEEKAAIINRLQQIVHDELAELSKLRLWQQPQKRWQVAYDPTGIQSTVLRKQLVHALLVHQIPIPQSISDSWAQAWIDEIKQMLKRALVKLEMEAEKAKSQTKHPGQS